MPAPIGPVEDELAGYGLLHRLWLGLVGAAALSWLTGSFVRHILGSPCEWASSLADLAMWLAFAGCLPLAAGYVAGPRYQRALPPTWSGRFLLACSRALVAAFGLAFIGMGLSAVALPPSEAGGLFTGEGRKWLIFVAMPASGGLTLWFLIAGRRLRRRSGSDT